MAIQSVEPNVADKINSELKSYKLDYKLEQESLNQEIEDLNNTWLEIEEELESLQQIIWK